MILNAHKHLHFPQLHLHPLSLSHFISSHNHSRLFITLGVSGSPACPVYFVHVQPRPADALISRSCVIWQASAKLGEWAFDSCLFARTDCLETKQYICFIYFCRDWDRSSAFMAAAVRNNVWVAPGQDAQFLHKTAPLTADGLRGEDHGQVLCNTRDAIPETSSFQCNNLVGYCIFSPPLFRLSEHQCLLMPSWWCAVAKCCWSKQNRLFSLKM